ncbi:MAG: hypothetical protein MJ156_00475 [Alphaproteobacteria bacterium]|nr:hypothetical protein [Alphaproteobacteria bacterium]
MPLGTSVPVVGNGMTLGITDGVNNVGLLSDDGWNGFIGRSSLYGADVGTAVTSTTGPRADVGAGVTTDPTKSGLIADLTNATAPTVAIIKY